jgi:hypothetical protein
MSIKLMVAATHFSEVKTISRAIKILPLEIKITLLETRTQLLAHKIP